MPTEKDFEDVLAKYPELIEDGLRLIGRQMIVHGRRLDLLFEDRSRRRLLIELKWGPIKDHHVGQIITYEGSLLSNDNRDVRVMLIGTRVPPNLGRALDHHGIAWKEITRSMILAFVREKQDLVLVARFTDEAGDGVSVLAPAGEPARRIISINTGTGDHKPAMWVPLKREWLELAFLDFRNGKDELYFGTDANIGGMRRLPISNVYFKVSLEHTVVAKARFIEVTTKNMPEKRVSNPHGHGKDTYKFYYGFRDLVRLPTPIPLSELRHFNTGRPLQISMQSPCVIDEVSV